MGQSANKKTNVQLSESTDSSLSLLILPNELLIISFSYLNSIDIIQSFLHINNNRTQNLIQTLFVHFNLTPLRNDEEQWIKTYFTNESPLCHWILSMRLTDQQMKFLSKCNIQFTQLESFHSYSIQFL